jgi:hypothetical protein
MVRRPAVAGRFYPADPRELRHQLDELTAGPAPAAEPRAIAVVVPHAGYIYSGRIAARTYASVRLPGRAVVLGPNHTGEGEAIAVMTEGSWETPLGDAPIDAPLARALLAACGAVREDDRAHRREHSLEVQIPFLQHLAEAARFVPVCVGTLHLPTLLDLGRAVAETVRGAGGDVLLVISSDMSHYVPAEEAEARDRMAIACMERVDPESLHRVVVAESISMCGVAPAVAGLEAARHLGARRGRLVVYGHSGERTGDHRSVVGYAGLVVT